jgi:two-component system nitrate/nitrite response regulator NarL
MLTPTQMTAASLEPSTRGHALTERELEVLRGVSLGLPAKILARQMSLSVKTIEKHCSNIRAKLDLHSAAALTRYYMTYVDPPRCPQCDTARLG